MFYRVLRELRMNSIRRVKAEVANTPHMTYEQAERMTEFIRTVGARDILELGFRHGVSTAYIAMALEEIGAGHVTTIDLESVRDLTPNVSSLLGRLGVGHRATVHFEPTSYVWRLMRMLEADPRPRFDLCYLDGAHSWFVDGFAFFLIDRLLRPGGWLILDDLDWTYASSPTLSQTEFVKRMPPDERVEPHVRKVYELLVKPHPSYHSFRTEAGWAFAQKSATGAAASDRRVVTETVVAERWGMARRAIRRLRGG